MGLQELDPKNGIHATRPWGRKSCCLGHNQLRVPLPTLVLWACAETADTTSNRSTMAVRADTGGIEIATVLSSRSVLIAISTGRRIFCRADREEGQSGESCSPCRAPLGSLLAVAGDIRRTSNATYVGYMATVKINRLYKGETIVTLSARLGKGTNAGRFHSTPERARGIRFG